MIASAYIHTITVKRKVSTAQNADGDQIIALNTIYTNIPARVETDRSDSLYTDEGVRPFARYIFVYLDPAYLCLIRDQIFFNGNLLGQVNGIESGWKGTSNNIDHYELKILTP